MTIGGDGMALDEVLAACERHLVDLAARQPCPEHRATLVAIRDARAWQQVLAAMRGATGPAGPAQPYPTGLGWEEI